MKLLFTLTILFFSLSCPGFSPPKAIKGIIDLSSIDLKKEKQIPLNGQWNFYWKKIIKPEEVLNKKLPLRSKLIEVPGLWTSLTKSQKDSKKFQTGYGSYLLYVKGLNYKSKLGFTLKYFATAYSSYIITKSEIIPLFRIGKVGKSEEESIPTTATRIAELNIKESEFYILIQSSNYHYRTGGFFNPFLIGTSKSINEKVISNFLKSFFLMGVILIMSLYHFGLYSLRRKDLGSFWFGVLCFVLFLREGTTETFLMQFVDQSSFLFHLNSKLEYSTMFLGSAVFLTFLNEILKDYFSKKIILFYWISGVIYTLIMLFTSPAIYTKTIFLTSSQFISFTCILYAIINIFRAALKKAEYSRILALAIGFLVFGATYDILVTKDIFPPPFIMPYTFIVFIFIQSYILATKFSHAYNTAEALSKDLEKEVVFRTKEAVSAKELAQLSEKNISNLLNNMRQSVFTINNERKVMTPVSRFTYDIFETNIEGKGVFDHIYASIDESSELYSTIDNVFNMVFLSDEFQWDLSEDYLPRRVIFRNHNDDDKTEKILKVAYTPLWNDKESLERIMFIVEDITEIEKLEKEMNEQKSAATKNIQMLQEMASSNKDDLSMFFSNALKLTADSIESTKTYRENIPLKVDFPELEKLFRNLHTIKGNSRIFGLSLISSFVHNLESDVHEFKELKNINKKPDINSIDDFIQNLYSLQGQVNDYMRVGQEVFDLNFSEDKKFKHELQQYLIELEFLFQDSIDRPLEQMENPQFKDKIIELKKIKSFPDDIHLLKLNLHTIKGVSRSIGERDISDYIHSIENGVQMLIQSDKMSKDKFNEIFKIPLFKVYNLGKSLYFKTNMHKDKHQITHDGWVKIFLETYTFSNNLALHYFQNKLDDHDLKISLEAISITSREYGLDLINRIVKKAFHALDRNESIEDVIFPYCIEMWSYLSLISLFDFEKNGDLKSASKVFDHFHENDFNLDESGNIGKTIFTSFLRTIFSEKLATKEEFLKLMEICLQCGPKGVLKAFIPQRPFHHLLPDILNELEDDFNAERIYRIIKKEDGKESYFFTYLSNFVNKKSDYYLRLIETLTLLRSFTEFDDESKEVIMPQVVEVLLDNFNQFKKTIEEIEEDKKVKDLKRFHYQFDRLLDMPVKYSFVRFKSVVKELSRDLGKKVKFIISGDQGSLNRDKLNLLLDSMIHLIRNSLDHGIETPKSRVLFGKEEFGTLEIECLEKKDQSLRISIRDDGKGVNPDAIVEKGIKEGLITKQQAKKMNDQEKVSLIFLPNFSTKSVTTEVSGRGVGMDVVKKNLETIGAELTLNNTPGKGTEFIIELNNNNKLVS
tara:strand:+ start:4947 stop:8930 length:3984 start_codon:yes stop_codon:yes gene_type:complete